MSALKTITFAAVIIAMFASQADAIFDELGAVGRLVVPMVLFFGLASTIAMITRRVSTKPALFVP